MPRDYRVFLDDILATTTGRDAGRYQRGCKREKVRSRGARLCTLPGTIRLVTLRT